MHRGPTNLSSAAKCCTPWGLPLSHRMNQASPLPQRDSQGVQLCASWTYVRNSRGRTRTGEATGDGPARWTTQPPGDGPARADSLGDGPARGPKGYRGRTRTVATLPRGRTRARHTRLSGTDPHDNHLPGDGPARATTYRPGTDPHGSGNPSGTDPHEGVDRRGRTRTKVNGGPK